MGGRADGPKRSSQGTFYPGTHGLTEGNTVANYLDDTRVAKFLVRKKRKRYCIECLKKELRLLHSQVEHQLKSLAKNRLYQFEEKRCSGCGVSGLTCSATWQAR